MENENGFQPQSAVSCAGADIQPQSPGSYCSDGHEWGGADGASQGQRLVLTTITATGQNTSLLWLQTGPVPGNLAALTLVAGTRGESVVWSLGESKRASGAKVEPNGLHHDKTAHFQLH